MTGLRLAAPDLDSAVANQVCVCGGRRIDHGGRTGLGLCHGHSRPVANVATLLGPVDPGPGRLVTDCPAGCSHFRWDPDDRRTRRAIAAAGEGPEVALRAYGAHRNRARARAKTAAGPGWSVGPSDLSGCLKAVEFRERPPEGHQPIPLPKDAADIGTMLHEEYTRARRRRYPWRRFKVPVLVPGLDRPGEADEIDEVIGRVTDYKSAGDWKWEQVGQDGPPEAEWKQVATYAFGLAEAGTLDPHDLEIIYINRENGRVERFLRPYSRSYALVAVGELTSILDALDAGRPLPRVRAGDELLGPTVNALCARHCEHVRTCWDLDNVPADRNPEGWLLARDDADGAITATLQVYDTNRGVAKDAAKQKDYARVLLEGVDAGRYGDLTVKWPGGNLSDPKPDHDARRAQLEQAMRLAHDTGEPPPLPEDLPYPERQTRSAVSIRVARVRAADLEREREEQL